MRTVALPLAILTVTLTLSACGGGTPFKVETRDPAAAGSQQTTYEQLIRDKRRLERTQGK